MAEKVWRREGQPRCHVFLYAPNGNIVAVHVYTSEDHNGKPIGVPILLVKDNPRDTSLICAPLSKALGNHVVHVQDAGGD